MKKRDCPHPEIIHDIYYMIFNYWKIIKINSLTYRDNGRIKIKILLQPCEEKSIE